MYSANISINNLEQFLSSVKHMNVLVIGETIVDRFIEVKYEGQSMKSNCPVLALNSNGREPENQLGGAAAIVNHLRDFVTNVDFITNKEEQIIKTRYIESFTQKIHLEVNKFENNRKTERTVIDTDKYDLTIVADFGHGFCDSIEPRGEFYLMCQTNSNNFGFNRVSKWKRYRKKAVCIDEREASLQLNKKENFKQEEAISNLYNYEINAESLFITLGKRGSIYFDGAKNHWQPVFPSEVVDSIGAGDTFFAFSCLINETENKEEYLYIPSLAASLSTTWRCNANSITKDRLIEYANKFI